MMDHANILRRSSAEVSTSKISASVKKWRKEDGVARFPVPLLLGPRKVAVSGTEEYLINREEGLVIIHGKGDAEANLNDRRRVE